MDETTIMSLTENGDVATISFWMQDSNDAELYGDVVNFLKIRMLEVPGATMVSAKKKTNVIVDV